MQYQLTALLLSLAILRTSSACETVNLTVPKNGNCLSHALFLNPEFFVQFSNGTCLFHQVCARNTSQTNGVTTYDTSVETCLQKDLQKGTYNVVTKKIVKSVKTREFKWKCPSYEKVPTGGKVLLMRTHASKKVSPYFYFHQGNASTQHMTINEANAKRVINFKSPLMKLDKHASLYQIFVEMFDGAGRRKTSVGFRINPNESIKKGRWFAKDRLISSYPWSLSRMRSTKFNYFSIDGVKDSRATRRFFINVRFGGCRNDRGFMAIIERAYCSWEKKKRYFPSYIWTYSGSTYGRYNYRTYETAEFRIYGIFKNTQKHYVRTAETC